MAKKADPYANRRIEVIQIRLTPTELNEIKRRAGEVKLPMSVYIRNKALGL